MDVADMMQQLEELGWLKQLPAQKAASIKKDLEQWHKQEPDYTYLGLATDSYDCEMIEDDSDFRSLLRVYKRASGGIFSPEKIKVAMDHDAQSASIAFEFRGQSFGKKFSLELGDYVPEDFAPFINDVLDKAGVEQRFFTLPAVDQIVHLVFVTSDVYAAAERSGVLPT